jgi:hypothetical protein
MAKRVFTEFSLLNFCERIHSASEKCMVARYIEIFTPYLVRRPAARASECTLFPEPADIRCRLLTQSCHSIRANIVSESWGRAATWSGMDKFVARTNITHLHEKLATEQDEAKRQTLLQLLATEEAKLASLNAQPKRKQI